MQNYVQITNPNDALALVREIANAGKIRTEPARII